MISNWLRGLLRARWPTLGAAALGVAIAVALLGLLGLFVSHSASTMTARAVSAVAPDWQVQLVGTSDAAPVQTALQESEPDATSKIVDYADIRNMSATTQGTVQTTGVGKAVGLDLTYHTSFANQFRLLAGSFDGALLAQQTASNLHVVPGGQVTLQRLIGAPEVITIAGIVEMPFADQFFQTVGTTVQSAPTAPPDNIIILPAAQWNTLFADQLDSMPQTTKRQVHVGIDHGSLPGDPVAAYLAATGRANNLSAKLAGAGVIANNLAARLDGVRADALFAKVLFLFLGVPGAAVAILLTMLIVQSGTVRRRRDIALLQLRGAATPQTMVLVGLEALAVGIVGSLLGLLVAWVIAHTWMPLPTGSGEVIWFVLALVGGLLAVLLIFFLSTWTTLHRTVGENLAAIDVHSAFKPAWQRLWVDVVLLVIAAIVFWQSAATGYQVVVAPEGVATATVDYKAYLAPGLMWIGLALLLMRLWTGFMFRGRAMLGAMLTPVAGGFSGIVAASMSRDRLRIAKGVVLVALAFSFATSTAIFNTTYESQANVDAELSNGADVAVTGTMPSPANAAIAKIKSTTGVAWAEPMQHRFAYVGTDLQDIYGINPATIGKATTIADAYFTNNDAKATLAKLQATPNGVLVSDETKTDFQLNEGDTLNLRLQSAKDNAYHVVPFIFIGLVREFPTAPKDSFLIANSSYIATATENTAAEIVLVRTSAAPAAVAKNIRIALADQVALKVTDITEVTHRIGSSLVAVDLKSLTGLELAFALPIIAGALGLVFALGLEERRRNFAILLALGAKTRHLGAFLWSEAIIVYVVGGVSGLVIGTGLAWVLVKMMTHVFDPPPEALNIPWGYLGFLAITGFAAMCVSVYLQLRKRSEPLSFAMRKI
ncbi:MAG: FtsX-like permease family protein [Aestuariivirga sp.]